MKEEYLLTGELEPTNEPYAIAKIAGIKLCQSYNRQYGTNFISVMPTNLYGLNDNYDLMDSHVLPALIRKFHLAKLLFESKFDEIIKDLRRYGTHLVSYQTIVTQPLEVLPPTSILRPSSLYCLIIYPNSASKSVSVRPLTTVLQPLTCLWRRGGLGRLGENLCSVKIWQRRAFF